MDGAPRRSIREDTMRRHASVIRSCAALAALVLAAPTFASSGGIPPLQPNKVVVISTTDVKGKTGPCGCHIPKGGLSRLSSYVDSVRTSYGQVLLVDNGGFFPEESERRDAAWFLMDAMQTLGVDAVGVGERDLRFGRAFLEQRAKHDHLPVTSANLLDAASKKPVFAPYVLEQSGTVKVGIFAVMPAGANLGPAKDSLAIGDPHDAAQRTVAELRKKGAQVVLLLSQLGKTDTEDLVTAVDGVDAVVVGHNVAVVQKGRMVKNTMACYGGEQGQYACRTELTLDKGKVTTARAESVTLGPEVGDKPEVVAMVKSFEDVLNEKLRRMAVQGKGAAPDTSLSKLPTE